MFGKMIRGGKAGTLFLGQAFSRAALWFFGHAPTTRTPWIARVIFRIKLWSIRLGFWIMAGYWYLARPEGEGVKCLVFRRGKILLVRHTYGPSAWTLPGGGILKGEAPEEAAPREVMEELGLRMAQVFSLGAAWTEVYRREERVHYFFGEAEEGEPVLQPLEIAEARWFGPLTLPFPVSDRVLTGLELYERFSAGTTVVLSEAIARDTAHI